MRICFVGLWPRALPVDVLTDHVAKQFGTRLCHNPSYDLSITKTIAWSRCFAQWKANPMYSSNMCPKYLDASRAKPEFSSTHTAESFFVPITYLHPNVCLQIVNLQDLAYTLVTED